MYKLRPGRRWAVVAFSLVLPLVLAACVQQSKPAPTAPAAPNSSAAGGEQKLDPIKISVGNLSFPGLSAVLISIAMDQKLAEKNGLILDVKNYGQLGAFYAALATGETEASVGGVMIAQQQRIQGVPVQIVCTLNGLGTIYVVTKDPRIQSLEDLKGKSVAASLASAEFQFLNVSARSKGIDMIKDATTVNGGLAQVRSMLEADRADAGLFWEPSGTMMLKDHPEYRIIWSADQAWQEMTGLQGYNLTWMVREDFLRKHPAVAERFIKMFEDTVKFINENPEKADAIVVRDVSMPKGVLTDAVKAGRMHFDVKPGWDKAVKDSFLSVFRSAVQSGFLPKLPDDKILFQP